MANLRMGIILFLITAGPTFAQTLNIPGDYPTIQEGINASENGDTVLVSPGEYMENLNLNGKNIVLCSQYALSTNPADIFNTIINGSEPVQPDTASCLLIISGEDSTCVVQGFTITGGTGTVWEDEHGPGNFYREGGGILIQYSSPTIKNNRFIGNEALEVTPGIVSAGGGAIRCGDGNPTLLNNTFLYNLALYGAGIVLNYSDATIRNNILAYNSGGDDFGGGGIWSLSNGNDPVVIINNVIVYNHSNQVGGGIRLWASLGTVMNNIIWGNTAANFPQIHGGNNLTYNCIEGGYNGEGNIDQDPLFSSDLFMLGPGSPCIDAGNPDDPFRDPEDPLNPGFALFPSLGNLTNDIGVYGGPFSMEMTSVMTGLDGITPKNDRLQVWIYPNPVAETVSIRILSKNVEAVVVKVLTSQLKVLETMNLIRTSTSEPEVRINMERFNPGLYFLEVSTAGDRRIEKVIIQ